MGPIRTLLFVPGNKDRMLEKAPAAGADALLYDLEDAVPAAERDIAREKVGAQLRQALRLPRYVRINGLVDAGPTETAADLEAVVGEGLSGVVLPKAQSPDDVAFVAERLDRLERDAGRPEGKIEIVPMLESARGIRFAFEILSASPRVASVVIGSAEDADLMNDLGCRWSLAGTELLYARSKVLLDARAAGIAQPLDGVFPRIADTDGLIRDAENARDLGYRGKTVIHPSQIEPVNRVFTPTDRELSYYGDLIAAFEEAEASGAGTLSFRGKMIDRAMVRKARDLLQRFGAPTSV